MGDETFQQKIPLRRAGGGAEPAARTEAILTGTLREQGETRDCRIALALPEGVLQASGPDFFEAFCGVREQLEARGLEPVCYGASRNVFPSRLSRQRSSGLHAYRLELGRAGRREDLVEIFETGDDVEPVSVAEQREFFFAWLRTLTQP